MRKMMMVVMAIFLVASPAWAAIVGSKHDLSSGGSGSVKDAATTQVCVFCHTPHGASTTVAGPLWNRDSTDATVGGYTDPSGTMEAGIPALADMNDTDAPLCLSCHDGTVGNTLENQPNEGDVTLDSEVAFAAGPANLGTDLSNDHPIGMRYDDTNDLQLKATTLPLFSSKIGATEQADVVWCSSCHDVHGKDNGGTDFAFFLNDSMTASALCLRCHDK